MLTLCYSGIDIFWGFGACSTLNKREVNKMRQTLKDLLKKAYLEIEPSQAFESVFWNKIAGRQREPWYSGFLSDLEFSIPFPTAVQTASFVLVAFLIGGTGGAVSAKADNVPMEPKKQSMRYLAGYHDLKGLPVSSMAAAYFQTIKDGSLL